MYGLQAAMLVAAMVITAQVVGCATAAPDAGGGGADGGVVDGGGDAADGGGKGPECGPGDRRECEVIPGCNGLQVCLGETFGECSGVTELCNGRDDDCDGTADEGFEGIEQPCATGLGGCQRIGVNVCAENGRGVICGAMEGEPGAEVCNGDDDDCDGPVDEGAECPAAEVDCDDGIDDDGDGQADCRDEDCAEDAACAGPREDCAAVGDEDGDGRADCDDSDCEDEPACAPPLVEICDQAGDEDGDGQADCEDADCAGFVDCVPPPVEACDEPGDEDDDGLADCLDSDCAGHAGCVATPEDCGRAGDEDEDGLADCADPDCAEAPACAPPVVEPVAIADPGGEITLRGSLGGEDRSWSRPGLDCSAGAVGGHRYELFRVRNDTGAWQGIRVVSDWDPRGVLVVMSDGLDPAAPAGCLAADRPPEGFVNSVISPVVIGPGEILTVVATTFEPGAAIGDYVITVATDGGVAAIGAPGGSIAFESEISGDEPVWQRLDQECMADDVGDYFYEAVIVVNAAGVARTVQVDVAWSVGEDGYLHVFGYVPGWDIGDAARCLAGNDDFGGVGGSRLADVVIGPRESRVVVVSTYGPDEVVGEYTLTVTTVR